LVVTHTLLGMSGTISLIIDISLYTHRLNVCVEPFEEHTGTVQFLYWNSLLEMLLKHGTICETHGHLLFSIMELFGKNALLKNSVSTENF
jgi:hypothetical protein